jgi:hypothetical protein
MFFNKQLFTTPTWLIESKELSRFDNGVYLNRIKSIQTNVLTNVLSPSRLARLYDNEAKNGNKAYTVADLFNDLREGIFTLAKPDAFKRNLQRGYVENLRALLNDDYKPFPGFPATLLASIGLTPINVALSDIRPMARAELKLIDSRLPKNGDALTAAHYADLRLRIKEALNPTRPIVNLPSPVPVRAINILNNDTLNNKGYLDCWPKIKIEE